MDARDALAGVLAALRDAALDDTLWPRASALIDETLGTRGNSIVVGDRYEGGIQVVFFATYWRGERRQDLEREYIQNYHPWDERVPRLRQLPDSKLVRVADLYTEEETKTSPTFNEFLPRSTTGRDGLVARLDMPRGSHITWAISEPIQQEGWGSDQIEIIEGLLPHVRHLVRTRQAVVRAQARGTSLEKMLENTRIGVIHLDRRGRIVEANSRALALLRRGSGLFERKGFLGAWLPADDAKLQRLLEGALPPFGAQAAAGSMAVSRFPDVSKLVLHINPVGDRWLDFGSRRVAALVLVVDPVSRPTLDVELVRETLGLTPAETEVAVMLAEGRTTSEIARATARQVSTVYMLIRRAYRKLGISRQADLVRLVLALADVSASRR